MPYDHTDTDELMRRANDGDAAPSRAVMHKELCERVRAALDQLGARDREVLVLWYLEEMSTSEIAAVLDLTEEGVKSRHRRALERLAPLVANEI